MFVTFYMPKMKPLLVFLLLVFMSFQITYAIKCYECSSKGDGQSHCDAYKKFDTDKHIAVECNSEESNTPGTFCMKYVEQSPIGFVWEGRWRQVIRRCASVAESGVTGVCNFGIRENGVYWEECYCSQDGCNGSYSLKASLILVFAVCMTWWRVL